MKSFWYFIGIFTALFGFTAYAYAGILGSIGGFIQDQAVTVLVTAVISALGVFGISYKLWGTAVKELAEFAWVVYKATKDGKISKEEMEIMIDEAEDIYPAVAKALAARKR